MIRTRYSRASPASTRKERSSVASFSLGRASAILASGTIVSRFLGFVMSIAFTQTIGLIGQGADAFTIANGLPNTVYSIIAGGALNAVLVPQIVRAGLHADGGRTYINRLLTLTFVVLLVATIIAIFFAPLLVAVNAAHYGPAQFQLAVAFAYWCLPQVFFYGLYTILGEVLNARGSFGPFTWTPVLNNIVTLVGLGVFHALFGADGSGERPAENWTPAMIAVLAGSATLGVALQAVVLVFFWKRVGLSYRPDFRLRGVGLGHAGRIAGWTFATLLLTVIAGFIENTTVSAASGQNASATTLQKAWLVFMLPHSVIAVSLATAYFTRMSGHATAGRMNELRSDISDNIRVVGLFLVPASGALIALSGNFSTIFASSPTPVNLDMSVIISVYAMVLPLFSVLAIVQRAFYSLNDGKTPFFYTLVQVIFIIIGCIAVQHASNTISALLVAIVVSLGIALQSIIACLLLRHRLGRRGGWRIIMRFTQYTVAALPAFGAGFSVNVFTLFIQDSLYSLPGIITSIISMVITVTIMALVYFSILWLFRVPELYSLFGPLLPSRVR
ncbi:murein biosynthesis integral membrane protein MurJ [Rathayibacter toxicus]|nr:murein biosynthesis integral membrane protein MurJ [Rathayibacter toxicus]QWL29098.1 murein biosynthesis integral membrane protein MurJ [Rathayibacter toxicus]QWL33278.1 murein biosynthesis integral membrane protein MurJ [Rathayibacter toxicus]QWL35373.1 murein biosynthesis integral membrane protein MurJ [Rathayibacter toxicus]QWL37503.1 murein biosynthesis integral membrane protein MurJ [Rathayibacter toxicus]